MASVITLPENDKSHHKGTTRFRNPWPSYQDHGFSDLFKTRFLRQEKNFVPIPTSRDELVEVRTAKFQHEDQKSKLKATWIGHASWFIEYPCTATAKRGLTLLLDPVFSDRTSPVGFLGPKRYSPLPCQISDLPPIDAVLISHNHYDHLDIDTVRTLHRISPRTVFICPLRVRQWFINAAGVEPAVVFEFDWWEALRLEVDGIGAVNIVCTPSQHNSARTPFDKNATLWCSWAIGTAISASPSEDIPEKGTPESRDTTTVTTLSTSTIPFSSSRLYFAGDTGYRAVSSPKPTPEQLYSSPRCPAFEQIGKTLGPFDLALLPIGLYSPRDMLSSVHCAPEDSVCVHQDIQSKRSIGMHWGTFRGGLSAQYEDVREPPRRFEQAAKDAGLSWGEEIGLCAIGETVFT